jgi:ABC-type multidrug transport system ATPase subunit
MLLTVQYLARVDRILVLSDGRVAFNGTYDELQREQSNSTESSSAIKVCVSPGGRLAQTPIAPSCVVWQHSKTPVAKEV